MSDCSLDKLLSFDKSVGNLHGDTPSESLVYLH